MDSAKFLEACRPLSLTARALLALLIFERFCIDNKIHAVGITEFLDYMWQWPTIDDPSRFYAWEKNRPTLVDYGFLGGAHEDLLARLTTAAIGEDRFHAIVSGVVLILWGSFSGAADDQASFGHLKEVVTQAKVAKLPPIAPFRFSKFEDRGGWGAKPTQEDCEFWRSLRGYA